MYFSFWQLVSLQAAIPEILKNTTDEFHSNNLNILREAANLFYDGCKEIPCLTCPHKPEGAMVAMVIIECRREFYDFHHATNF